MNVRRGVIAAVVGAALSLSATPALAASTSAASGNVVAQPNLNVQYRTRLVQTSSWTGARTDKLIKTCTGVYGVTCSFTQTEAVTTTISLGLGMSRSWVAGNIGFSSAAYQSIAVGCSAVLSPSQPSLRLYPSGTTKHYYIVQEQTSGVGNPWYETSRTGDLEAFQANGIACY